MRIGPCNAATVLFVAMAFFGRWATVAAEAAEQRAASTAVELCGTPAEIGKTWGTVNRQAVRDAMQRYLAKAKAEKLSKETLLRRAEAFVQIAERIAPHWFEEAHAIARGAEVDADLYVSFVANSPRGIGFHECTSYAAAGKFTQGGAAFFHKNRDNVDRPQAAYVLASSVKGVNKFIAISNASATVNCSMIVNDKGLAGSADYPAHLTRKGDPHALLPEAAEPRFRGMMNGAMLRHVAERAADCRQALDIVRDLIHRGYYAGGTVNGTHWLFVDRTGTILEISSNARHVVSRIHTQKAYISRLDGSAAAKRLRGSQRPIDFHLFHNVSRDPSICLGSSISGMTVELDAEHPETLTCAWVSLPARSLSFPLFMGARKTPRCLLSGDLYKAGKRLGRENSRWETLEKQAHAEKQRLAGKVAGLLEAGQTAQAADRLDAWTEATAGAQSAIVHGSVPGEADRSHAREPEQSQGIRVTAVTPERGKEYPAGTKRIAYRSGVDGAEDWALFLPGDRSKNTIVYLHGSFSHADQIFTRKDVREFWLTRIQAGRHPLLSVNLRGTAYMSPAATADLTGLLRYCEDELGCRRFVLLGGSGGASSALAYAVVHPERIHGVIAMGTCDIRARLDFARRSSNPLLQRLARTVFAAYGGTLEEKPEAYRARSVLAHADRLTMPVILTMGENDPLIPVVETRKIAAAMRGKSNFVYHEIPKGGHDAALWVDIDLETLQIRNR